MDMASDTTTEQSTPAPPSSSRRQSYLMRHWRGTLPLGLSYWVNCCLVSGITSLVLGSFINRVPDMGASLRMLASLSIVSFFLMMTIWFWSIVGVWRSAGAHVSRGGSRVWAIAARVMIGIGALTMTAKLSTDTLPQLKEFGLIAIGQDPMGALSVRVSANGQSVIIRGMLREGSADQTEKILNAAAGARLVVLDSPGGRVLEAERLARIIQRRNLDTYVEGVCASACTLVFLAGKDRASTPNARIGFHQPGFIGLNEQEQAAATGAMMAQYRSARLPDSFIQKISSTSPREIWFPSRKELIEANVITRVSLGGEAPVDALPFSSKAELLVSLRGIDYWQAIERRFPGMLVQASDLAWAAMEKGGNDSDMTNATRRLVSDLYPRLLKTAGDDILESYLKLAIDQLEAARDIGANACMKLMSAQLDITKTLPGKLVEQDQEFLMLALNAAPRPDKPDPDPHLLDAAMQTVFGAISPEYAKVMETPAAYGAQPALVCDATIAFFQSVARLPAKQRLAALRGMFQRT
jgi:hypothetical protein